LNKIPVLKIINLSVISMISLLSFFHCDRQIKLQWHEEKGYKWADLPVENGTQVGFEKLSVSRTGIDFENSLEKEHIMSNRHLFDGSGVALGDVNGDGLCDIYLCRLNGPNALYRNKGNMKFEDMTEKAGVAYADQFSKGALFADIDGDRDLDLIVTIKGDSIACRIDSINDTHIYYEMKSNYVWIHTQIDLNSVSHYAKSAIEKGQYKYEPGTTIIRAEITDDIRRNSIYAGIGTINYARTFGAPAVITLGSGLIFAPLGIMLESTLLIGGTKHYFEPGINVFICYDPSTGAITDFYGVPLAGGSIRIGYRYQGPEGFLFRIGPQLIIFSGEVGILPAASIGYSF